MAQLPSSTRLVTSNLVLIKMKLLLQMCLVSGMLWTWVGGCISLPGGENAVVEVPKEYQRDAGEVHERRPESGSPCLSTSLLDHTAWMPVPRDKDPYKGMAPAGQKCDDVSYKIEQGVLEIQTGICPFLTLQQPLKIPLAAGDTLKMTYWHLQLTAASTAHAYVSLSIGEQEVYHKEIPIPHTPDIYEPTILLKRSYPVGTPISFHIHNHGSNTWKLLSLERICHHRD